MEELYYVKVETHHNNIKGQWIAEETKAQFNNTVIEADDYHELLNHFKGTVYAGDKNFPRCTFDKIEAYEAPTPIDKSCIRYIRYYARKSVDYPDVTLILTPVRMLDF